jgi:predicted HAD superfamily Cof-like phosphohydrolase
MSNDWVYDIERMHKQYGVGEWVKNNPDKLKEYLDFRLKFLYEELNETALAVDARDPEEIVDGLIDLCVVAIGTLDAFNVDAYEAWDRVAEANMAKQVGQKESRPNPLGLPDLVKPSGWKAPDHSGNHGLFENV